MAVANKTINGSVSISGRGYSFWLICKESDVNNTNNTSDVTVEAHIKSTNTRTSTSGWTFSITINGKEYKETSKTLDNYGGGSIATNTDVKVYSKTYDNCAHNSNGTKTVNISCTLSKSSYGSYDPGKCTASGTYTLTSIPRMKNPSVGSNPTINEEEVSGSTQINTTPVTISTNSQASNFRFTVQVLDGSTVVETVATGVSYTTSWTPTLAKYAARIHGASKQFTIKSTGTTGVTGTGTCNVTVGIARTNITAPTTSSNQVSYSDINTMPTSMTGLLIQSKSRLSFLIGQTCYTGASPAAAGIRIENQSKTSTTLSGNNVVVDMDNPIQGYGTIKAYGNVRDSRGFRYINSSDQNDWVELKSFTVYKYKQPTFESDPVISRVNANGTPDDQGEYLAYSMNARVSAVRVSGTNKNSAVFKVKYRIKGSSSAWTECSFAGTYDSTNDDIVYNVSDVKLQNNGTDVHISASTAYEIEFELDDAFNYGQSTNTKIARSSTINVGGDLLNFNVNGHAMAIGQLSTATQNEEKLEIAYPTAFKTAPTINGTPLVDMFYPTGSIYMSTTRLEATKDVVGKEGCPIAELGGTWERIQGRFLLAANDAYTAYQAGATGGHINTTLQVANLPAHTHGSKTLTGKIRFRDTNTTDHNTVLSGTGIASFNNDTRWSGSHAGLATSSMSTYYYNDVNITATHEHASVGSGTAFDTMPPFVGVYTWQRTA